MEIKTTKEILEFNTINYSFPVNMTEETTKKKWVAVDDLIKKVDELKSKIYDNTTTGFVDVKDLFDYINKVFGGLK